MKKSYRILVLILIAVFAFTVFANAALSTTAAVIGGGMVIQWLLTGYGLEFGSAQEGLAELYDRIGERLGDAFDYYWNNIVLDPNGNWKYGMNTAGLIPYWNPEYDQWAVNVPIPSEVHKEVYDYLEEEMVEGENDILGDNEGIIISLSNYDGTNYYAVCTYGAIQNKTIKYVASSSNSIQLTDLEYTIEFEYRETANNRDYYDVNITKYNNISNITTKEYKNEYANVTNPIRIYQSNGRLALSYASYVNTFGDLVNSVLVVDGQLKKIGTVTYNPTGFNYEDISGQEIKAVVPLVTNADGTLYIGQDGVAIPDEDKYNDLLGEKKKEILDIPDTPILDFPDIWNPAMPGVDVGSITTVTEGVEAIVESVGNIVPGIVEWISEMPQKVSTMMNCMGSLYEWVPVEPRGFVLGAISVSILGLIVKFIVGLIP